MRFYGRFASAYGTMMLAVFAASVLMQSHIRVGMLGYYGFPLVALGYAVIRSAAEENPVLFARNVRHSDTLGPESEPDSN